MTLVNLFNPTGETIPKDMPTEWSVFLIGNGGDITVKDGQNIPTRQWVTYRGNEGYTFVGLWDGMQHRALDGEYTYQLCRCYASVEII